MAERPLGIFGGSFDPVHFGHLRLAQEAATAFGLERVLWLPAGQPPHRRDTVATARQRLDMVRLAIAGNPLFELDASEVLADAPSYTVTTLERLRLSLGGQRPLVLLLGADAYAGLSSWQRWRDLFSLAHLGLATRGAEDLDAGLLPAPLAAETLTRRCVDDAPGGCAAALAEQAAGRIACFALTRLDISATHIRAALAAHASPRYLLPNPVLDYIERHKLYR